MRTRNILFAVVAVLILGIGTGCSSSTTNGENGGISSSGAFIGGTKGIAMEFLPGAPPDSVFDVNYPFSVNVKTENVGEWEINKSNIFFTITGVNPSDFGLLQGNLTKIPDENLDRAQKDPNGNQIQGTVSNIEFNGFQYQSKVAGQVQFNVKAEACYLYGTTAQTQLCISKDFLGKSGEKGTCVASENKNVENSGAPVHITTFTESVVGNNKLSFIFNVKHVGTGAVYEPNTLCSTDLAHRNKVKVKVSDPAIGQISCSGLEGGLLEGIVTLYQGERSIRCTLTVDNDKLNDYEKVINIQVMYDYKDYIETPLLVKQGS